MCIAVLMTTVTTEGGSGGGSGGGGGALTAVADPTTLFGYHSGYGTATTYGQSTVTTSGGVAPLTYHWQYVSGDTGLNADTDTSSSTRFSALLHVGDTRISVWKCVVTDAASTVVNSNTVEITLSNSLDVGGGDIP